MSRVGQQNRFGPKKCTYLPPSGTEGGETHIWEFRGVVGGKFTSAAGEGLLEGKSAAALTFELLRTFFNSPESPYNLGVTIHPLNLGADFLETLSKKGFRTLPPKKFRG